MPSSPHLDLSQVTLVAVDTRAPGLAAQSLQRSMAQINFGRVLLFTHAWATPEVLPGIETVDCGPIRSGEDYSRFILHKLPAHIHTAFVLVTQWDGFVVDAAAWRDEFLTYDYIGAVWPDEAAAQQVGNGGFSLRSRRLLDAGLDPHIQQLHPEDRVLCRTHRAWLQVKHGVRFAPPDVARRFAFENEAPSGATLGFHGPHNLPRVLDEATLSSWLDALPTEFFRSRDARRLARALLARRMPITAKRLLQRRAAAGRTEPSSRVLSLLALVMGLFVPRST
jgi:Protein of unknown function (DUF5672)